MSDHPHPHELYNDHPGTEEAAMNTPDWLPAYILACWLITAMILFIIVI